MPLVTALRLVLPALLLFLADQLIKVLAVRHLAKGPWVLVAPWVQFRYTTNPPRSQRFSHNRVSLLFLWGATLVSLVLFMGQGALFQHPVAQMGLGAALGGAASNLYDLLRRGAVIDLVKIGWWPVFNLADVGITAGAIAALWFIR